MVGCATTKGDWKKAQSLNTVEAYQEFLRKHPKSEFTNEAKRNIMKLHWQRAKQTDSVKAYQEFLQKYPESEFSSIAKDRIEELEWQAALKVNTIEAYQEFLEKHSQSKHVLEAKERIEELIWTQAEKSNKLEAYGDYLLRYPNGKFANLAREKIEAFLERRYKELSKGDFVISVDSLRKLAYVDYDARLMLENLGSFVFGGLFLRCSISFKGTYDECLDTISRGLEMKGIRMIKVINNPFKEDTKEGYKELINKIEKVEQEVGLNSELKGLLRVAKWRLAFLEKFKNLEQDFIQKLKYAKSKDDINKLIYEYKEFKHLVRKAKKKLEDMLISEIRKDPSKSKFVIPDILPVKGSYTARVTIIGQKGSEFGFLETEYPGDGPLEFDERMIAKVPLGDGSVHRYKGKYRWIVARGVYEFVGDKEDPLTFVLLNDIGYVYLHGKGKVIFPDGKEIRIGYKELGN